MSESHSNMPKPMPGYVRPGIDDRPDLDDALSDNDMEALARLSVWGKAQPPEASVDQISAQSARLAASGSPLAATAASLDTPALDLGSAYLDKRDPVVAANGERPNSSQRFRLNLGFMLAAILIGAPWIALNAIILPQVVARLCGVADDAATSSVAPTLPLAALLTIGVLFALLANALISIASDQTRTRFGRRTPWILTGGVLSALITLILGSLDDLVVMSFFWAIMQFAYAMLTVPVTSELSERVPDKFRPRIEYVHGIGIIVGQLLGVCLGVLGVVASGVAFPVVAALFLVAALVTVLVLPKEPSSENITGQRFESEMLERQFRFPKSERFRQIWLARVCMMTSVGLTSVFLWYLVRFWVYTSGTTFLSAPVFVCIVAALTFVGALLASLIAPALTQKIDSSHMGRAVVLSVVLYIIGLAVVWVIGACFGGVLRGIAMLIFAFVCGFAFGLIDAFCMEVMMQSLPNPATMGHDIGMYAMANSVGLAVAALLGAALVHVAGIGYIVLFPAAIVMAALCAILTPRR